MRNLTSILLAVFCLTMISCNSNYELNVEFENHNFDGKKAYLTNYDTGDTIESAIVSEKKLVIKGNIDTAYFARLWIEGNRLDFVVESGDIKVEWGDVPKVSGTPLNDKYNALVKQLDRYESEWQRIAQALKNGEITEDEAQRRDDDRKAELLNTLYNNYLSNKDNVLGEWAFTQYVTEGDFSSSELDLLKKKVPEHFFKLKRVEKIVANAVAKANTSEGKPFVDFSVKGIDGNTDKLSQYAGDGVNYLLVDFWASWCNSCLNEISGPLTYLYDKYNGKGLKIIGVAVWDEPTNTQKAIKELSIPWHVMVGDHYMTAPTDIYGIAGIPYIILISPDGKIVNRGLNGDALIKVVESLIAGK